jgi:hypothetical protein
MDLPVDGVDALAYAFERVRQGFAGTPVGRVGGGIRRRGG